jgi:hypothetical protein
MGIAPEPDVPSTKCNPYESPQAFGVCDESVHRRFPWGVLAAVPLFMYGAIPLLFGAVDVFFLPITLVGGGSVATGRMLPKLAGWVLYHIVVAAHGFAIIVAARNFWRLRWRHGVFTIAVGVTVPAILIAAFYIAVVTFGLAM